MFQRVLLLASLLSVAATSGLAQETPNVPSSFSAAKNQALTLYDDHRTTFYCECSYTAEKKVERESCGYEPRNENVRARRIEWEHVVPASRFGRVRKCWLEREEFDQCIRSNGTKLSSRKCCRKVDTQFKAMEADLHNLRPAVGELNGDRSNRPFGEIAGEIRDYGQCDFEVSGNLAEPRAEARGEIARTYLYFERVWGMTLTTEERSLFEEWNREDPPDEWEIERNRRVKEIQRIGNHFVETHASVAGSTACIPREKCCRICKTSQACGDSCISRSATCRKAKGCACDASAVCD